MSRREGTLLERVRAKLAEPQGEIVVHRVLEQWNQVPNADDAWAWYADFCEVFEASHDLDPQVLAFHNGMRAAFWALYDFGSVNHVDLLERLKRADRGEYV